MMQRILFLIEGGPSATEEGAFAGSIRYFKASIAHLRADDYDVTFGTVRNRGAIHGELEELGCKTFALDCRSSASYPAAALRLSRMIRRADIDILHLNEPIPSVIGGIGGVLARRALRIFHRHHTYMPGIGGAFSRVAGYLCHNTMAVSEAAASAALSEGVAPHRVTVALNGVPEPRRVPPQEVRALRQRLGIGDGQHIVVAVGHLRPEKGHRFLLEAMSLVTRQHARGMVHLVIVGGGTEADALTSFSSQIPELNVHFVGHQPDVPLWFALGDVTVVPSLQESFGLVAAEAMACGRPIVASKVEGLLEIIEDGRSGLLVQPKDVNRLAAVISRVLSDDRLAQDLARGARERYLERFTIEAMVGRWVNCYKSAAGRARVPR